MLDILFKEISRWGSLTIFCDRWEPFQTAFQLLNAPHPTGAASLEFLEVLEFQPYDGRIHGPPTIGIARAELVSKGVSFEALFPALCSTSIIPSSPLPVLRHIAIRGVPVNWINLSQALGTTNALRSLDSLELSLFYTQGRIPTCDEFSNILTACPRLRKLVMKIFKLSTVVADSNSAPVHLSQLEELHLEYGAGRNDVESARRVLKHIYAPTLARLVIQCGSAHAIRSGPHLESLVLYAREWCVHPTAEIICT
jgi:hypothetical protein